MCTLVCSNPFVGKKLVYLCRSSDVFDQPIQLLMVQLLKQLSCQEHDSFPQKEITNIPKLPIFLSSPKLTSNPQRQLNIAYITADTGIILTHQ